MIMYVDVKKYAQAKLRCRLSGRASVLADYIVCEKEGFLFRMSVTMLVTNLSRAAVRREKSRLFCDYSPISVILCTIFLYLCTDFSYNRNMKQGERPQAIRG
jgi:hypothetical protein